MKTIKQQFKSVSLVLSLLILFQGCTVYKSSGVTLKRASESESKVLVQTKGGQNLKFQKIINDNGVFYGLEKRKRKLDPILLNKEFIEKVRLKDEVLSIVLPIVFPLIVIVGAALVTSNKTSYDSWDFNF